MHVCLERFINAIGVLSSSYLCEDLSVAEDNISVVIEHTHPTILCY